MSEGGFMAGAIVGKLLLDRTGFHSEMVKAQKETAKFGQDMSRIGASIGSGFVQIGKVLAVAGMAAAGALAVIVKKTADAGDALWDMSQRTGIGVEMLSGLKLAADKSGTSLEGLAVGLRFLGRNMAAGADVFKDLGISVTDASGKLRPMQDVMLDVAGRFAGMEDGAEKSALAMKIFGRSGTELIPMLNLGAAGLREQIALAEKLGMVFTEKTARAADRFNDAMVDLKAVFTGVRNDIANALIPVFTQLASSATEGLAAVRGQIAKFIASGKLQEWAAAAARAFIWAFKIMAESVAGLMLLLPSLKASIFSVAEGFYKTLGKIAEGISLIPGVSAQAAVALKVWGADFKDFADTYGKAADDNNKKVSDIRAGFEALFKMLDIVSASFGKVSTAAAETAKVIGSAVAPAVKAAGAALGQLSTQIAETPLPGGKDLPAAQQTWLGWGKAVKDVSDKTGSVWEGFVTNLQWKWESAINDLLSGAKSLKDGFIGIFKAIRDAFIELIAKVIAKALAGIVTDLLEIAGIIKTGAAAAAAGTAAAATTGGMLVGSAAAGGAIVTPSGFLMAAPGVDAGAGAAAGTAFGVAFAAFWAVNAFKMIFGKTEEDKWIAEYNKKMMAKWGADWESHFIHNISKGALRAPELPPLPINFPGPSGQTPGTGSVVRKMSTPTGDINITLHVSTLDSENVTNVVRNKVIPVLREAARRREFWIPLGSAGGV